jgi:heat-inducible transcriptional repressor
MTLDKRKSQILESIIRDYVETAEPVGSRSIVKKHNLKISAATVRNEMADLEEMGYLEQPHTSAGRIPSQVGFRYYVDCMMQKETLDDSELELLHRILNENIGEWSDVVSKIGSFLSQVTNYASFVIVPSIKLSEFKDIQIIPLSERTAMLLVLTDIGVLLHRKIEVPPTISGEELQLIGRVFTRVLSGTKLEEMRRNELKALREELRNRRKVIDTVLEAVDIMMQGCQDDSVVISGSLNILNEPEFKDLDKLKRILTILEEDVLLKQILPDMVGEEVNITIGNENKAEDIKEMSLVVAGYNNFGEMGKIGVIGPIRMEYWKAAFLASISSSRFSSSAAYFSASFIICWISSSLSPLEEVMVMVCSLLVARSLAVTLTIPFTSISNLTSI